MEGGRERGGVRRRRSLPVGGKASSGVEAAAGWAAGSGQRAAGSGQPAGSGEGRQPKKGA